MKSAQNYLKQQQIKLQESGINRQKSLDQSTQRVSNEYGPPRHHHLASGVCIFFLFPEPSRFFPHVGVTQLS